MLIAAFGFGSLLRNHLTATPVAGIATIGGITATPHMASWMSMNMGGQDMGGMGGMDARQDGQDGYQMPAQMMPGAPADGETRLGVPVTLTNESGRVREFHLAKEFFLVGGHGNATTSLKSATSGGLTRLNPDSAVDGVLYFDVKDPAPGDPPLYLKWARGGSQARLAVRIAANTQTHSHGS